MARRKLWVGLDVGEERTTLCVLDDEGRLLQEQECSTDAFELKKALSGFPRRQIQLLALEAGCGTHLTRKLRSLGYPVAVFEARKTKRFLEIRRNKTDLNDARGIAELARLGRSAISEVRVKGLECQMLLSRLRLRQKLVQHRVAVEGFLRSILRLNGGKLRTPRHPGDVRNYARAEIERIRREGGADLLPELEALIEICESLRVHLKETDAWVLATANANHVCRLFMEIPGVGPISALSFYSTIEDPRRFRRSSDAGAYLGLTPRVHESGNVVRRLGITRMGSKFTRSHLVTAATVLLRPRKEMSALQEWGVALGSRIGRGKARVAVARKLAALMLSMWKYDTHFEPHPAKPRSPQGTRSFLREAAGLDFENGDRVRPVSQP